MNRYTLDTSKWKRISNASHEIDDWSNIIKMWNLLHWICHRVMQIFFVYLFYIREDIAFKLWGRGNFHYSILTVTSDSSLKYLSSIAFFYSMHITTISGKLWQLFQFHYYAEQFVDQYSNTKRENGLPLRDYSETKHPNQK